MITSIIFLVMLIMMTMFTCMNSKRLPHSGHERLLDQSRRCTFEKASAASDHDHDDNDDAHIDWRRKVIFQYSKFTIRLWFYNSNYALTTPIMHKYFCSIYALLGVQTPELEADKFEHDWQLLIFQVWWLTSTLLGGIDYDVNIQIKQATKCFFFFRFIWKYLMWS